MSSVDATSPSWSTLEKTLSEVPRLAKEDSLKLPLQLPLNGFLGTDALVTQCLISYKAHGGANVTFVDSGILGFGLREIYPHLDAAKYLGLKCTFLASNTPTFLSQSVSTNSAESVPSVIAKSLLFSFDKRKSLPNSFGLRKMTPLMALRSMDDVPAEHNSVYVMKEEIEKDLADTLLLGENAHKDFFGLGAFSNALWELLCNVELHASHDRLGNRIKNSMNAVLIRRHRVDSDLSLTWAGYNTGERGHLLTYFNSLSERKDEPLEFVELSIVDSGPGIVERFTGESCRTLEPLAQKDIVERAFEKWASSRNQSDRGIGLYSVLLCLFRNSGLIRIRTNGVALLQLFSKNIKRNGTRDAPERIELGLWRHGDAGLCNARGTAVTILMPLKKKEAD